MKSIPFQTKSKKILKAFTVLELIIVVVIIGILSAVVYVGYGSVKSQARDASVLSDLDTLDGLMTNYALENNVVGKAVYLEGSVTDTDLDFTPSEGNIIDVVIDDEDYCIRGYNTSGTKDSITNAYEKESSEGACDRIPPSFAATGIKLTPTISVGYGPTCAIASDNQAYCWGINDDGQIGDGTTTTPRLTPTAVDVSGALAGKTVKILTSGIIHACIIASDDQAYCWGYNNYGQIGDGTTTTPRLTPTAVDVSGALAGKTVKTISSGGNFNCIIASDDQAYCWGYNNYGQIGDGTTIWPRKTPIAVDTSSALAGKTVKTISSGGYHACVIASDDQAYCWGFNMVGQIGDGTTTTPRLTPTAVDVSGALAGKTIKAISSGEFFTCVIASDNQAYCWGHNASGQIGDGTTTTPRLTPTAVDTSGALAGKTIKTISSGRTHACVIASDDQAYCWGKNDYGQIGDGTTTTPRLTPTAVDVSGALAGKTIKAISSGGNSTCAIASDNQAYCWGINDDGQIGDGTTTTPRLTPTAVSPLP